MNDLFARAVSFGDLFSLFWMDFFLPKLSVLARAVVWNTNERDVCTSREFWQLIFLVVDGIFFSAKTQRKVRFKNQGVSLSCVS